GHRGSGRPHASTIMSSRAEGVDRPSCAADPLLRASSGVACPCIQDVRVGNELPDRAPEVRVPSSAHEEDLAIGAPLDLAPALGRVASESPTGTSEALHVELHLLGQTPFEKLEDGEV